MEFEEALVQLKLGARITNRKWNGKDMCIFMQLGYPKGVPANANTAHALRIPEGTEVKVAPYIMMLNAQGVIVPWLASQMDLFSDGWEILGDD